MATITFDTHKYIKTLEGSGISEIQAEAFSVAQKEAMSEVMGSSLATKDDIHRLELEMRKLEMQLVVMKWMLGTVIGGIVALIVKAFFA